MTFKEEFLSPDVIANLELIDLNNTRVSGSQLQSGNMILTKEGKQAVFLIPLAGHKRIEHEHAITVKTETESRIETHRVSNVKELSDVLTGGFGLTLLYKRMGADFCVFKEKEVSAEKIALTDDCDICGYCKALKS